MCGSSAGRSFRPQVVVVLADVSGAHFFCWNCDRGADFDGAGPFLRGWEMPDGEKALKGILNISTLLMTPVVLRLSK